MRIWYENHKADLRDYLLRLTKPEQKGFRHGRQNAEGRFTTGHAELHLVRAMAHHAMGNDQEAPPGEREQWVASLHMIFNILLGNQDQMIIYSQPGGSLLYRIDSRDSIQFNFWAHGRTQ